MGEAGFQERNPEEINAYLQEEIGESANREELIEGMEELLYFTSRLASRGRTTSTLRSLFEM